MRKSRDFRNLIFELYYYPIEPHCIEKGKCGQFVTIWTIQRVKSEIRENASKICFAEKLPNSTKNWWDEFPEPEAMEKVNSE